MVSETMSPGRLGVLGFLWLSLAMGPVHAQDETAPSHGERAGGNTGIGVSMGDLDGVSLKLWTGPASALQVRLGSLPAVNSGGLIVTYARHFQPIDVPDDTFSLPIYVGAGVRFGVISAGTAHLEGGMLGLVGMSVLVPDLPVDLYFELRPTFLLFDDAVGTSTSNLQAGFFMESGIGAHFYY